MKKTLRYLLIVMGLMSVLSISAQALAQKPEAQMQSTSVMAGSGSTLPNAAVEGPHTTYDASPTPQLKQGPNRAKKARPDDNTDPYKNPIGDAAWPLALLAFAYAIYKVRTRKRA